MCTEVDRGLGKFSKFPRLEWRPALGLCWMRNSWARERPRFVPAGGVSNLYREKGHRSGTWTNLPSQRDRLTGDPAGGDRVQAVMVAGNPCRAVVPRACWALSLTLAGKHFTAVHREVPGLALASGGWHGGPGTNACRAVWVGPMASWHGACAGPPRVTRDPLVTCVDRVRRPALWFVARAPLRGLREPPVARAAIHY